MLYSEKYSNIKPGKIVEQIILVGKQMGECIICDKPTCFIDITAEQFVCSEECEKELDD